MWKFVIFFSPREWLYLLVSFLPSKVKTRKSLSAYSTPKWHAVSGIVECLAGASLYFLIFLGDKRAFGGAPDWFYRVSGSTLGLLSLLGLYAMAEGVLRCVASVFLGATPGVGPVVLVWALGEQARSLWQKATLWWRLGPPRSDRLLRQPGGSVEILSCSRRLWRVGQVVDVGGVLFLVLSVELVPDGPFQAFRYILRPLEPGEVIRGHVVRYPGHGEL